jgi:hypothetical protein
VAKPVAPSILPFCRLAKPEPPSVLSFCRLAKPEAPSVLPFLLPATPEAFAEEEISFKAKKKAGKRQSG